MSYQSTGLIEASDYNNIINLVNQVFGIGFGDSGYGGNSLNVPNITSLPSVLPGGIVNDEDWLDLRNAIQDCALHQNITLTDPLPDPTLLEIGDLITFFNGLNSTDNLTAISNNRSSFDPNNQILSTPLVAIRSTPWSSYLKHEFTVNFGSHDNARYFFNTGGQIRLGAQRSGGSQTPKNQAWSQLLIDNSPYLYGSTEYYDKNKTSGQFVLLRSVTLTLNQQSSTYPSGNLNAYSAYSSNGPQKLIKWNISVKRDDIEDANQPSHGANGSILRFRSEFLDNYTNPNSVYIISNPQPQNVVRNKNFTFTGSIQTWQVPLGVTSINAKVWGAGGVGGAGNPGSEGGNRGGDGGGGAFAKGDIPVTPGETLTIYVGGTGSRPGVLIAGGGGGFSAINRGGQPLILAGGGGGGGFGRDPGNGGAGGAGGNLITGLNGNAGAGAANSGGKGGTPIAGGAGGQGQVNGGAGGKFAGGEGDRNYFSHGTSNGGYPAGGAAHYLSGGGGGSGYYGGGAGAGTTGGKGFGGGGGAGGVSFVDATVTNATVLQGSGKATAGINEVGYTSPQGVGGTGGAGTVGNIGYNGLVYISWSGDSGSDFSDIVNGTMSSIIEQRKSTNIFPVGGTGDLRPDPIFTTINGMDDQQPTQPPAQGKQVYSATHSIQNFVVPADVTSLQFKLWGAAGGGGGSFFGSQPPRAGGNGGGGAFVGGSIPVTPGETLIIQVGSGGAAGPVSGGGGGGGYTAILRNTTILALAAAGGGGGSGRDPGNGGSGGAGGNLASGQNGTASSNLANSGGHAGTSTSGGVGGSGSPSGQPGGSLYGGNGGNGGGSSGGSFGGGQGGTAFGGGGGGAGYFGGGGGGSIPKSASRAAGGGAGGSSYVSGSVTSPTVIGGSGSAAVNVGDIDYYSGIGKGGSGSPYNSAGTKGGDGRAVIIWSVPTA